MKIKWAPGAVFLILTLILFGVAQEGQDKPLDFSVNF
jgi:hypothetical protein